MVPHSPSLTLLSPVTVRKSSCLPTATLRPSGRGERRAGIRHRPGGRRWRARLKTLRIDRNGRVTLPGRARIGGLRQAPLISRVFPALYGILFALLAETA